MPLLNIFKKSNQESQESQHPQITADIHEKNSLVISYLSHIGIDSELKKLPVADFIVQGTAIERKSVLSDTPVIIKTKNKIKVEHIKKVYKDYKKNKKIKVMGIDINRKNICWSNVYDMTKHKTSKLYGLSLSPKMKKKYPREKNFTIKITDSHNVYVFRKKKIK